MAIASISSNGAQRVAGGGADGEGAAGQARASVARGGVPPAPSRAAARRSSRADRTVLHRQPPPRARADAPDRGSPRSASRRAAFSSSSRRITSSPVARSRLPVGSSASSIAGCMMVARAIATRWRWPPESSSGRWWARSARPKPASASLDPRRALRRRDAGQHHRQRDVLGRRQPRHQVEALEDEADALAAHARLLGGRQRRDVAPFEQVGAGVGRVEQAEHVEQRRLARARRPHHRDVLAGVDRAGRCRPARAPRCRRDGRCARCRRVHLRCAVLRPSAPRRCGGVRLGAIVRGPCRRGAALAFSTATRAGLDAGALERGDDAVAGGQAVDDLGVLPVGEPGLHLALDQLAVVEQQHAAAFAAAPRSARAARPRARSRMTSTSAL